MHPKNQYLEKRFQGKNQTENQYKLFLELIKIKKIDQINIFNKIKINQKTRSLLDRQVPLLALLSSIGLVVIGKLHKGFQTDPTKSRKKDAKP